MWLLQKIHFRLLLWYCFQVRLGLPLADILDKSEKIGLLLLVIPYAATAAAIHNTIIIEIIIFDFSNIIPPNNLLKIII